MQFIKTPYSWLFHITRIRSSEYNVKKSPEKIKSEYITILILQKIHTTIWTWKSLQKSILLSFTIKKTPFELQQNSMFSGNEIKQQNKICGLCKNRICGFLPPSTYDFLQLLNVIF